MMSLRNMARSAPRAASRVSAFARSSFVARASPFGASAARAAVARPAAFSTSILRRAPAGEVDLELANKLESELGFESELKETDAEPASIKDFLENGPFTLVDTPGQEKVVLTRTFGNEKITVSFTIADLAAYDSDAANEMFDEPLGDEEVEGGKARANQSELSEDNAEEEFDDAHDDTTPPCRLFMVVEKPDSTRGALNIEATVSDGQVSVDSVYYYEDAELAKETTAETAHKASSVYPGPPFGTLDEDLQVLMERYLEERGVTSALAVFVPEYMDTKEQREYINWLKNVKKFIEA